MISIRDLIEKTTSQSEQQREVRQAERTNLSQMRDAAFEVVTTEPELYQKYLTLQADNIRCSAGNVALTLIQLPDASKIGSIDYLATLKIPTLGLSVKVYQGTDSDALRKGAGHFASTSIWDGNVAIAGHNRGVNNHFGKIHTLDIGDTIKLTTKLGTRTYEVYAVYKVSVDDMSVLNDSTENIITLVTCVMNQPDYRWCVQARAKI